MAGRIDIPVDEIEEEFKTVKEFLKEEYPSRETYGKRWIGKKTFKIANRQINSWKEETQGIKKSWSDVKKEIKETLEE